MRAWKGKLLINLNVMGAEKIYTPIKRRLLQFFFLIDTTTATPLKNPVNGLINT